MRLSQILYGCKVHSHSNYECEAHSYAMGVKLIHIKITSVRLRYATDVKLIHIKITSVRLSHRYAADVKLIHI